MRNIFNILQGQIAEQQDSILVTIIGDSGSAPRHAGAGMLIGKKGRLVGTIGGGAVEYKSEQIALELLKKQTGCIHNFTLRPNTREDIGMQCGGDVSVLFEFISGTDTQWANLIDNVCDTLASNTSGWLIHPLDGSLPALCCNGEITAGTDIPAAALPSLCNKNETLTDSFFSEPLPSGSRVLIFGGGHIAQALTPMLAATDFQCIVLDDRPEYSQLSLFPGAADAIQCDYNNINASVSINAEDYIVIMTQGHKGDLAVEEQVLRSAYAYLGVVGSRHKIAFVNQTLEERGIDPGLLTTIHTPIGLPIRAKTPAEIAVSILAELILCRAELRDGTADTKSPCPMHKSGS